MLIEHLLCERISLRGICRGGGGQSHVVTALYGRALCGLSRLFTCPAARQSNNCGASAAGSESDELWSFVQKKAYKQWIWIAMDAKTARSLRFTSGSQP